MFTLTSCIEDESEHDEAEDDDVELLESREDATIPLQPPDQPFDFVAPFVRLPVVFPRVEPGLAGGPTGSNPNVRAGWRVSFPS